MKEGVIVMKLSIKDMVLCAVFAALISIGAYVSVPLPSGVPFSLQPFFAMLAGAILGSKRGGISMAVYTLMGLVGLPVFSNGTGGFGMIFKPTFGYILGFILCAYVVGLIVEKSREKEFKLGFIIAPFVGLIIDYIIGVPYLFLVLKVSMGDAMTPSLALAYGFWPYIILDLVKACIVVSLLFSIVPRLEREGILT